MRHWLDTLGSRERLWLLAKSFGLFFLLLLAIASVALHNIIATESNPFFYARF
jgi:hypothetical protein